MIAIPVPHTGGLRNGSVVPIVSTAARRTPSGEGHRRFPGSKGFYRSGSPAAQFPCTCSEGCVYPCEGSCGCGACAARAHDTHRARSGIQRAGGGAGCRGYCSLG
jgi:hypothetical protein